MESSTGQVLVTGASGQLGSELCKLLRGANLPFTGSDIRENGNVPVHLCDLRSREDIQALFASEVISTVVHLAGVLPSAFAADPIAGAEINVLGSVNLLREAIRAGIRRFIFGSSLSVYGSESRMVDESSAPVPDEPYGVAKHLVELVGERLHLAGQIEFVALRIARVVGPGTISATSPWRMELADPHVRRVSLPFAASARIAMVHAAEVAKMLLLLATVPKLCWTIYDAPAEVWSIEALQVAMGQKTSKSLILGEQPEGGPVSRGERFRNEFHFELEEVLNFLTQAKN